MAGVALLMARCYFQISLICPFRRQSDAKATSSTLVATKNPPPQRVFYCPEYDQPDIKNWNGWCCFMDAPAKYWMDSQMDCLTAHGAYRQSLFGSRLALLLDTGRAAAHGGERQSRFQSKRHAAREYRELSSKKRPSASHLPISQAQRLIPQQQSLAQAEKNS